MYTVTYLLLQKEVCTHVALLEPLTQGFFVSIWVGDDPRWRPSPLLAFPLCAWGSALGLLLHGGGFPQSSRRNSNKALASLSLGQTSVIFQ